MLWVSSTAAVSSTPTADSGSRLRSRRSNVGCTSSPVPSGLYVLPGGGLGGPLWVDAPAFDLDAHVHIEHLPAPADEAELRAVARLRRRPLDRSRPPWEMWFLTGLPADRTGWFVRLHHVADGIAGVAELGAFLDAAPTSATRQHGRGLRRRGRLNVICCLTTSTAEIAKLRGALRSVLHPAALLHRVRAAMPALRELFAEEPGPQTSLNQVIGRDRTLALVRSSLEPVNEVAHIHNAKVNDVLLAVIAGGLRGLLQSVVNRSKRSPCRFTCPSRFARADLIRKGESDQSNGRPASSRDRRILAEAAADRGRDCQAEGDRPSVAGHDVP